MVPVTYIVIEFPGNKFKGEILPALDDLESRGIIHILDLLVVKKHEDGSIETLEVNSLPEGEATGLAKYASSTSGLFSEQDIDILAEALENNTSAGFLLFEHLWARTFIDAVAGAEGRWLLMESVSPQILDEAMAALPG